MGDVRHSRVARSDIEAFTALGATVRLVGPRTLMPPDASPWGVEITDDLDSVIGDSDVVYMLRMQRERMNEALVPHLGEYSTRFGLDAVRAARMKDGAVVMHPGPMNRGVEMMIDPSELPRSLVTNQVASGVSVRMAVLFDVLGGQEVAS